jgi:S-adenosylmethionine hydrolase
MPDRILTLTTDFGAEGPYVAAMKGVILGLAPGTILVDVSHAISPQNIMEGAFVLASVFDAFPTGTIHLAVVDPGVGTARRLIVAKVAGQWFVLPDNGLISGVVLRHEPEDVFEIDNPDLRRSPVSSTFHGRDILAPAAAHLLSGGDPARLGPPRHGVVTLPMLDPRPDPHGYVGEVIFRDAFGNLITNLPSERLAGTPAEGWTLEVANSRIHGLSPTYGVRPPGALVALVGSTGLVEIAVVNGDASKQLNAGPGTTVWFRRRA